MPRLMGFRTVFAFAIMWGWLGSAARAEDPTVVLGIRSINSILDASDLIAESAGTPGLRSQVETNIEQISGGHGEDGIDRERSLGAYWNIDESNPQGLGILVVFIPVLDVDKFETLVRKFVPNLENADGKWTANVQGVPLYGTVADDYFYVTTSSDGLSDLAKPESIVDEDYDIAIDLNIAGIPAHFKETFLAGVEQGARNGATNDPPANQFEARGREIIEKWMMAAVMSVTNEGKKLTFGIDIDGEEGMATIDLDLSGVPNSALAKSFTSYGKLTPAFANLLTDSTPLSLILSIPTTGLTDIDDMVAIMREGAMAEIEKDPKLTDEGDKKAAKDVVNRLMAIFQATVKSGSIHSGLVLEKGDEETIRILGGTKLAKGEDAGKLWDDIIKLAKESPDLAKVKTDAAKHAGARIHSITPDAEEKQKEMFGEGPAHLAIRSDSLWFSIGGGNLDALKGALDQFGKKAEKAPAPISLKIKPATLVTLMEENDEALIERATAIAGEDGDVFVFEIAPAEASGIKLHVGFGLDLFNLAGHQLAGQSQ